VIDPSKELQLVWIKWWLAFDEMKAADLAREAEHAALRLRVEQLSKKTVVPNSFRDFVDSNPNSKIG